MFFAPLIGMSFERTMGVEMLGCGVAEVFGCALALRVNVWSGLRLI